ncbi:MAG: 4-hydroxythreonine-4-phosphate dehydrogenase PdxA [Candidatus Kapabacteria bacterium]|jgi:4-hydroxythreonine-4-phosphate dehydrogenase|nr:4-hydroxythreonine-4-phosphate dehydrogenase PdxA [Candidatus Kapabacteria bacterium]
MKIIISAGDMNGIGSEVMFKAIAEFDKSYSDSEAHDFYISGNSNALKDYAGKLPDIGIEINVTDDSLIIGERNCTIVPCKNQISVEFGVESVEAGKLAAEAIEIAVERTFSGEYDAMVTMPVSKAVLYSAGWKYPGHTEMLADRCNVENPMMILCTKSIRVALITIHIGIADVPGALSQELIIERIKTFDHSLKYDYAVANPKIAVLGLNPHAGENGTMGREDEDIVAPSIKHCAGLGIDVDGPHPSDGFFAHGSYKDYDGILAVYHDQGLIPLKLLAQGAGINVSAGLPIVRTSPDHGTAFAIAGKGIADGKSSAEALEAAVFIAESRKSFSV